jgi:hypothetical protein
VVKNEDAATTEESKEFTQLLSNHLPQLCSLHLYGCDLDESVFQPMPCLQTLRLPGWDKITIHDFNTFVSCLPSLTSLDIPGAIETLPQGCGRSLVSACPNLVSLKFGVAPPFCTSDLEALRTLALTSLHFVLYVDNSSTLQASGQMTSLKSLTLIYCDTVFQL